VIADNVSGLNVKDAVIIKGMKVGHVKDISFIEDSSARLVVLLKIDKEINIPKGSSAKISISENSNSRYIEIITVGSDIFFNDNDTLNFIKGFDISNDNELQPRKEKTEEMLESFDTLIQITELLSQYNTEMTDAVSKNTRLSTDLIYRIQIMTSKKNIPLNDKRFSGLADIWSYFHNGVYKYTAGLTNDYKILQITRDSLRNHGYPQAFIIAFRNGKRISMKK